MSLTHCFRAVYSGAIGRPQETDLLEAFMADTEGLVRESCEVALDAADYWSASATAAQEE
jgi:hypothetical protein